MPLGRLAYRTTKVKFCWKNLRRSIYASNLAAHKGSNIRADWEHRRAKSLLLLLTLYLLRNAVCEVFRGLGLFFKSLLNLFLIQSLFLKRGSQLRPIQVSTGARLCESLLDERQGDVLHSER